MRRGNAVRAQNGPSEERETSSPPQEDASHAGKPKQTKRVSCRECVRTKLKCSREPWPCDKCTERGIAHLCPGQQLSTRPYKRQRLARKHADEQRAQRDLPSTSGTDTGTASPELASMPLSRNKQQHRGLTSNDEHSGNQSTSRQNPSKDQTNAAMKGKPPAPPAWQSPHNGHASSSSSPTSLEHRGTLMIDRSGGANYYGPGSHSFLLAQNATSHDERDSRAASPLEPYLAAHEVDDLSSSTVRASTIRRRILDDPASFLAIPGVRSPFALRQLVEHLCIHLPSQTEARRAFGIYRYNVSWMYDPIASLDLLWEGFYGSNGRQDRIHPHRVSLVFSVLSLGVLFDVGRPNHQLAERYYHWSWAAVQLSNPADSNTLEHVQTLHLVGQYLCNRQNGKSADSFFPLMGTAMRSAIALGLHREGTAWNLSTRELEDRRRLFWDLYASDCFRSLAYGRPCSISDAHVDVQYPSSRAENGLSDAFHTVKFQVVRLLNRILDAAQRPDVAYQTVLDFDRELRELWALLPAELNPLPSGGDVTPSKRNLEQVTHLQNDGHDDVEAMRDLHLFLQGHTIVININQSILHLHRPWFVRALQQEQREQQQQASTSSSSHRPATEAKSKSQTAASAGAKGDRDAFDSRFARSIVAVSESSRSLIHSAQAVLDRVPTLGGAWNYFWQHCFNAGVCQCLQVLHNPSSITTFGALDDVRRALSILRRARPDANDVVWAGKIDLLVQLQARAEARLRDASSRKGNERSEERDPMLRLVGVTSSIDRRGRGERAREQSEQGLQPTQAPIQAPAQQTFHQQTTPSSDKWLHAPTSESGASWPTTFEGDAVSNGPSPASFDLIPALSHSLIDSWMAGGSGNGGLQHQNQQLQHPMPVDIGLAPTSASDYPPLPPDNSQFDRLLTELLAGGNEPDVGFWESMFNAR